MLDNTSYFDTTIALIGQFAVRAGGVDHNIVQLILAGLIFFLPLPVPENSGLGSK